MLSNVQALKSTVSIFTLHKKIKEAGHEQGTWLGMLDPAQSKLNDFVKARVEGLFEKAPEEHCQLDRFVIAGFISIIGSQVLSGLIPAYTHIALATSGLFFSIFSTQKVFSSTVYLCQKLYQSTKNDCFSRFFPTTQSVVDKADYSEKKASQVDRILDKFSSQHHLVKYATMGLITVFTGFVTSCITLKIPIIFAVSGITFIVVKNHSAFAAGIKDFQRVANHGKQLLRQPYVARVKIKELRKGVIDAVYPEPSKIEDDHTFHFASAIRTAAEGIYGTKEEAEKDSTTFINQTVCPQIRTYEKNLRFKILSRVTDATVKKISTIVATQAFRLILTNLTGLGLVAVFYYATHLAIDTPHDFCEWYTPLEYTWNRVFLLSSLHKFPEMCVRYKALITFSDLTKWALRLYIWNRMITTWEKSRETAVEDLMRPIKEWSQEKWDNVIQLFSKSTASISQLVSQTLQSVSKRFTEVQASFHMQRRKVSHIRLAYCVNVDEVRSTNLKMAASRGLRQPGKRLQIASLIA